MEVRGGRNGGDPVLVQLAFGVLSAFLSQAPADLTPEEIHERLRAMPMAWDDIEPFLSMIGIGHGDFNDDRSIDVKDLAILIASFGEAGEPDLALRGDLDSDGDVDMDDVLQLIPRLNHEIIVDFDRYTRILVDNGLIDPHGQAAYQEFAPYVVTSDPDEHTPFFSDSWDGGDHDQTISGNYWPPNHSFATSDDIPTPPSDHNMIMTTAHPNEHSQAISTAWPPNHVLSVTNGWPAESHSILDSASRRWPPNHFVEPSSTWPADGVDEHRTEFSALWPPTHFFERSSTQQPYEHYIDVTEGWPWNHDLDTTHERWPDSHLRQFSQGFSPPPFHQYTTSSAWPPNHFTGPSNTWPHPNLPWPPNHFFAISEEDGVPLPQTPDHDVATTLEWFKEIWDLVPKGDSGGTLQPANLHDRLPR